jgi:hypothetical protein
MNATSTRTDEVGSRNEWKLAFPPKLRQLRYGGQRSVIGIAVRVPVNAEEPELLIIDD